MRLRRIWWRVLGGIYALVRPLVVPDMDPHEDYVCMECGKPVLRRYLFCSERCTTLAWGDCPPEEMN